MDIVGSLRSPPFVKHISNWVGVVLYAKSISKKFSSVTSSLTLYKYMIYVISSWIFATVETVCLPDLIITSSKGSLPYQSLQTRKDILKGILKFHILLMNCTFGLAFLTRLHALLFVNLSLSDSSQKKLDPL